MTKPFVAPDPASLLRSLTCNVPGAIYRCTLDSDWTMHLIGDEIERITGYPAEDFIESRVRTYMSLVHPRDHRRVEREVWVAVQADRPYELEYRLRTAAGDYRWVLERGCAVQGHEREWLDGIIFDITDRRRAEERARHAQAEAAVAREVTESRRRMMRAADDARRRIERDLHDGAQQALVCALMMLRSGRRSMPGDAERAAELIQAAEGHLERGIQDLRDLAHGIHPSLLSAHGLAAALGEVAARTPVPVHVVDDLGQRLPTDANPSEVRVQIGRRNGAAFVRVFDDGVGGASLEQGSGLRGLSDRLATLGGTVVVTSPPGAGTSLLAEVPVAAE
jgi:PAS domain S-box-containing protein